MATATSHVISSNGLAKFRYYYFVRKWGKDVLYRIFNCCFLEGSSKTLFEILDEHGLLRGRKNPFFPEEIDIIMNGPLERLDITALSKICRFLWARDVNVPSDTLVSLVREIKDLRGRVSHDELSITLDEVDAKLKEFGRILEDTLNEAEVHYPCHHTVFNQMKKGVWNDIPNIQKTIRESYDPSNPEDCRRFKAEMEEFGEQLREFIREKCVGRLLVLYKDLCQILPFDMLCQYGIADPCSFMVSLRMVTDEEFHGSYGSHEAIIIDQDEVLKKRDPRGNDPKVVIISGDAGTGKTTLLCSYVEKWQKREMDDIQSLSSYTILFYMEFRRHDYENLEGYLRDMFQQEMVNFGLERVKSSLMSSKCLILCDGYDERNSRSSKLFEEMLTLKCDNLKIIVTTRPVSTEVLTCAVNKSRKHRLNLSMLGLREEEMKRLITKTTQYLVQNETQKDELEREIILVLNSMTPEMKKVLMNPLHLNIFILIYVECPELRGTLTTVTKLYIELKKFRFRRLLDKLGMTGDEGQLVSFEKLYEVWSFKYCLQKKFELKKEDISVFEEQCDELELTFEPVMSSYFNLKHSHKGLDLVKIYCYRHRTEQEFAAASAICDTIINLHENRSELGQQRAGKNIIVQALMSVGKNAENAESQIARETRLNEVQAYIQEAHVTDITRYITSILYNNDKDILYCVIEDILDMTYREYQATSGDIGEMQYTTKRRTGNEIDNLLLHLVETDNDNRVTDAVLNVMKDTCGDDGLILNIKRSESLSCVSQLLSRIKPIELSISLSDDPDDLLHLIPALEAAVQKEIEISLRLMHQCSRINTSYSDKYLEVAKTCVHFSGHLSKDGVECIPMLIKDLELKLDFEALGILARSLPLMPQLSVLQLHLRDDGSTNPDDLVQLPYSGNNFIVSLDTNLDMKDDDNVECTAKILNVIWPREGKKSAHISIFSSPASGYTETAVELLLKSLEIQPTTFISIYGVTDDAKKNMRELGALCWTRGLGKLYLLAHR